MSTLHTVLIKDFKFDPSTLSITAGDTVQWTNKDSSKHTATRTEDPKFDTGRLAKNETSAPVAFDDPSGNDGIGYFCTPHPSMTAVIVVNPACSDSTGKANSR